MNPRKRDYFDRQVRWVLRRLPDEIHEILEEVPLHIEDRPSRRLMEEMKIPPDGDLCGCFAGLSIDEIHVYASTLPNTIMIFRRGIFSRAYDEAGRFDRDELRRQIRITILHELAHFHGMDEDELDAIGYG